MPRGSCSNTNSEVHCAIAATHLLMSQQVFLYLALVRSKDSLRISGADRE